MFGNACLFSLFAVLAVASSACRKTPLEFSPGALPEGTVGQPYRVQVQVQGADTPVGGMSVTTGALPPGLELHFDRHEGPKNTATIEGTPTRPGEYPITVDAWCYGTNVSGQTGAREYRIVVR